MAFANVNGQRFEIVTDWRLAELAEAENALGIDMEEAKGAARLMLALFISIRKAKPDMPVSMVANMVGSFELSGMEVDEDEKVAGRRPPLDENGGGRPETSGLPTTGHRLSVGPESRSTSTT